MKKELKIRYTEYTEADLPIADRELLDQAARMARTAYAPYSHFQVGAAIRLQNGTIVGGSNQENAAYPSGLCAERVALFSAAARFPDQPIEAIAVTVAARQETVHPVFPCGACRQSIAEYEHKFHKPIRIILRGTSGKITVFDHIESLLPFRFDADELSSTR